MEKYDETTFKNNFRMSKRTFDLLCSLLSSIERKDTNFRKCIPLKKRIAIALYALGSSGEYRSIANIFGIGRTTVGEIVIEFCKSVWDVLKIDYMNTYPLNEGNIESNIRGFEKMGLPQCIGALGNYLKLFYSTRKLIFNSL